MASVGTSAVARGGPMNRRLRIVEPSCIQQTTPMPKLSHAIDW